MIYVISGFMRSGTTMMMKALEAGGMDAAYHDDLYELYKTEYEEWDFPKKYDGKLIKALAPGVLGMSVMPEIKIVFMRRDVDEIVESHNSYLPQFLSRDHLDDCIERTVEQLWNRKDVVSIDEMWYRDVLKYPKEHFMMLDWPVDVESAVKMVDPELCHFGVM